MTELSRRRVLVGAAWATPAVLIATGSPPAAASGDVDLTLVFNGGNYGALYGTIQIVNSGGEDAPAFVAGSTVTLTFPPGALDTAGTIVIDPSNAGWSAEFISDTEVRFTYDEVVPGGEGSSVISITVPMDPAYTGGGSVSAIAVVTDEDGATGSAVGGISLTRLSPSLSLIGTTAMTLGVSPQGGFAPGYLENIDITITVPSHHVQLTTGSVVAPVAGWELSGSGTTFHLVYTGRMYADAMVAPPELEFTVHNGAPAGTYSATLTATNQFGYTVTASA